MTEAEMKARVILRSPGRDWRFWAAVSVTLLIATVSGALVWAIRDANSWQGLFERASAEQTCVASAAATVNLAESHRDNIVTEALIAVGRGDRETLAALVDDLEVARDAVASAIAAQQQAVLTCGEPPEE